LQWTIAILSVIGVSGPSHFSELVADLFSVPALNLVAILWIMNPLASKDHLPCCSPSCRLHDDLG
jgi:hypothetical protein